jgi:hypothetical protein
MSRPLTLWTLAAFAASALTGCAHPPAVVAHEAFAAIELGMAQDVVEAKLGAPVFEHATVLPPFVGEREAWYLQPPALDPVESPWGPGAIRVGYGADGRVTDKQLNPQCGERR